MWLNRETIDWTAYRIGANASRITDSDPKKYPNIYKKHTANWYSFNIGWNSHQPDDEEKGD